MTIESAEAFAQRIELECGDDRLDISRACYLITERDYLQRKAGALAAIEWLRDWGPWDSDDVTFDWVEALRLIESGEKKP